jgi:error-prone DNA polymerase
MSSDPFVHLHVASGYSMRYGASHPHVLAQRAAEHGMDTLALTDRDGTYGAVKFVQATRAAGIRPVLGVDLAIEPSGLLRGAHPSLRARGGVGAAGGGTPVGAGSASPTTAPAPPPVAGRRSTCGTRASRCSLRTAAAGRRCAGWCPPPTCGVSAERR